MKKLIVDSTMVSAHQHDFEVNEQRWPVSRSLYSSIRDHVYNTLVEVIIRSQLPIQVDRPLYEVVVAEIFGEVEKIISTAVEASEARRGGLRLIYSPRESPLIASFDNDEKPDTAVERYFGSPKSDFSSIKRKIKSAILFGRRKKILTQPSCYFYNPNPLLKESFEFRNLKWTPLWVEEYSGGLDSRRTKPETQEFVEELSEKIVSGKDGFLQIILPEFQPLAVRLVGETISRWISRAQSDSAKLQRKFLCLLGGVHFSGTPKYEGRLISRYLIENGGFVTRFEHGGERPFFTDRMWSFSELLFCSEYRCFGRSGASMLQQTYGESEAIASRLLPEFVGQGSRAHQDLVARTEKTAISVRDDRRIIFVPSLYLGEKYRKGAAHLGKWHDIPSLYLQRDLIQSFKNAGVDVVLKKHPGGIPKIGNVLDLMCSQIITRRYNPLEFRGVVQVFDWAGTAFISAMATDAPIILFLPVGREISNTNLQRLSERVVVVEVSDDESKLRYSAKTVMELMNAAREKAKAWRGFAWKSFWPDDAD
jgi:hypothetical protein